MAPLSLFLLAVIWLCIGNIDIAILQTVRAQQGSSILGGILSGIATLDVEQSNTNTNTNTNTNNPDNPFCELSCQRSCFLSSSFPDKNTITTNNDNPSAW
jgi:hypothetical protein